MKFTSLSVGYISEEVMTSMKKCMYLYIAAYSISSIIDVIVEVVDLENGPTRFLAIIFVTLGLDLSTVGTTLILNYQKTRHVKRLQAKQTRYSQSPLLMSAHDTEPDLTTIKHSMITTSDQRTHAHTSAGHISK